MISTRPQSPVPLGEAAVAGKDSDHPSSEDEEPFFFEDVGDDLEPAQVDKKHQEILDLAVKWNLAKESTRQDFVNSYGQYFDTKGTEGYTILHAIVRKVHDFDSFKRYIPLLELLLEEDKDLPGRVDEEFRTALYTAAQREQSKVVIYLCENVKSDPEWLGIPKRNGDTCIHIAIQKNLACTEYLIRKVMGKGKSVADEILNMKGEGGNTPLHIAVEYERCSANQEKIVELLLEASSAALSTENTGKTSKSSFSPVRYHQETKDQYEKENRRTTVPQEQVDRGIVSVPIPVNRKNKSRPVGKPKQQPDVNAATKIEARLTVQSIRTHSRDDAIRILHGPIQNREIDFDLSPRKTISEADLNEMDRHLRFEPVLQYVGVPNLRVVNCPPEQWKDKPFANSKGRKDYLTIFKWLNRKGVKQILKVIVEDDHRIPHSHETIKPDQCLPHSDEVIEDALREFDVEIWDWRKFDICSQTIVNTAPNVRDVQLYCSGNDAILRSWSAETGLVKLKKLEVVRLEMHKGLESTGAARASVRSFVNDLRNQFTKSRLEPNNPSAASCPSIKYKIFQGSEAEHKKGVVERGKEHFEQRQRWMDCMKSFADFIQNFPIEENDRPKIKVALVDDGVDVTYENLSRNIKRGETYSKRHDGLCNAYYQSTNGHGTVMACLIRRMCPNVRLYVAKLDERQTDDGMQITTSSAAKAINWATAKGVHVISMSWTIEKRNKDIPELEKAVNAAVAANILLFCATDDQGNTRGEETYPAQINKNKTFRIGAATASGDKGDQVRLGSVDYLFPGDKRLVPLLREQLTDDEPRIASSLATALASGLAGLVLYCAALADKKDLDAKHFEYFRNHEGMTAAFKAIGEKHGYLQVWKVFEDYLSKYEADEAGKENEILNAVVTHLRRT